MTFVRVNPGGWALYETLTSVQMNQLDINASRALDGADGGSYTPIADLLINGRLGARPANLIPAAGWPVGFDNGDLWYDTAGADRIYACIAGAMRMLVVTDGSSLSRSIRIPMSAGQEVMAVGVAAQWTFSATNNRWESPTHDGASYMVSFPLAAYVPQDAELTEIRAYINVGTGNGSPNGVRVQLVKKIDAAVETVVATGYDSGAPGAQWIVLSGLTETLTSDTHDYFVRVRVATSMNPNQDIIHTVKATFTLPVVTTIP